MALSFQDLEKLPDNVTYELPDGTKVTLGEIRKAATDHVNSRIADLTPREQKLVSREAVLAEAEQKVRETMEVLAAQPLPTVNNNPPPNSGTAPPPPLGYTQQQWDAILADPYMRPLVTTMAQMAAQTEKLEKLVETGNATAAQAKELERQQKEAQWINYQLDNLNIKDPAERKAVLDYATDAMNRRDMSIINKARTYDTAVANADKTGYERGLKEGRGVAPVPSIVHGTRTPPVITAPEALPKDFREFSDAAANDQSLINEIRESSNVQPPQQ